MKALIVSYYRYPNGDAGAVRQHNLAKIYKKIGYDVAIIGMGNCEINGVKNYDNINYVSFREPGNGFFSKIRNVLLYTNKLSNYLSINGDNFDVIHVSNTNINILVWLKSYVSSKSTIIIHDSVEWYSAKQFKLFFFSPSYIMKNIANSLLINKRFKVISISKYLFNYYSNKGIDTIRVPIVFDSSQIRMNNSNNDILIITYAGTPGKKDYLEIMLKGVAGIPSANKAFEFRIFGVSESHIKEMCIRNSIDFEKVKNVIKIYGRVNRSQVIESLGQSDFSVMIRDADARYAKAGFPTKIVESLACGTPVITNISSDLGEYLKDLDNCIIVDNCDSISFTNAIFRALNLNNESLSVMKRNAYETALNRFNIDIFTDDFKLFLNAKNSHYKDNNND